MIARWIREITVTRRILRQFAWVMAAMLGVVIPLILIWINDLEISRAAGITGALGLMFLVAGLFAPGSLKYPYIAWMQLALLLGLVMTRVIITLVYYGLMTPIGLIRRQFGRRDVLGQRPDPGITTYWVPREKASDREQMKKHF